MVIHQVILFLVMCHTKSSNQEDLTQKWFVWGQLYSYCTHIQKFDLKEVDKIDEFGNEQVEDLTVAEKQRLAECMNVFTLDFHFNLTKCLLNCNNSVSCIYGCRFYSHITGNTEENIEINKQNKPDLYASLEVILLKRECYNLSFWWPNVYPKNTLLKSVYLVTFITLNGDNQTERVLILDSKNYFIINEKIFCDHLGIKSAYDIGLEFQLNVYPINYHGYNESIKMSSSIAKCGYVSSFQKTDCIQANHPTITSKRVQPAFILPTDFIVQDRTISINPGLLIGVLNVLMKEYTVSFKVKPTKFEQGLKSVFHLTLNKDAGAYGDRNPGIWFHQDGSRKLVIFLAVNGNATYNIETPPLLLDQWSTIKISQSLLDGNYRLSVDLNGENIHRVENNDARDFRHIKVYASNPWNDAQNGFISDILIINGNPGIKEYIVGEIPIPIEKGRLLAVIPKLDKEYIISLDIILNSYVNNFTGMFQLFQINGIFETVFLYRNSLCFRLDAADYCFMKNQLEPNVWLNIEVSQIIKNMVCVYRIKINGELFLSIVKQCFSFAEIKVYASEADLNMQYGYADGSIKKFVIINGISNRRMPPVIVFSVYYADYVNYKKEFPILKGTLIATLKTLMKVYSVSLSIKPTKYAMNINNVFHITLNEDTGAYGDRNPGIWFHQDGSGKLVIFLAVNGNATYNIETPPLLLDQWSTIKISQNLLDGNFWLSVDLNDENIHRVQNYDARDFKRVKVYASNPWHDAQNGSIANLLVINGKAEYLVGDTLTTIGKAKKIAAITMLEKEHLISFDIKFNKLANNIQSIISFFNGSSNYLIVLLTKNHIVFKQLLFSSLYSEISVNNKQRKVDLWYNVVIIQFLENLFYKYAIKIDGETFYIEINKDVARFENASVYISPPDFENIDGSIKNLFIVNGYTNSSQKNIFVLPSELVNKDADYINYKKEFDLFQNTIIGTLRVIEMEYIVSFDIKPTKYTKGLKSVLHLTLDEDFGAYGNRNPGVWFHEDGSGKLSIFVALNGDSNYYVETPALKLFEWSSVKISQMFEENKFWLLVDLNGVNIYKAENFDARDFSNIKVYASDPWYNAQQASINDLLIINGKIAGNPVGSLPTPIMNRKILAERFKLEKEHFISFDFKPNKFYCCCCQYNVITFYSRINTSFVIYDFSFLSIIPEQYNCIQIQSVSMNKNDPFMANSFTSSPFELNSWSNVEVARFLKDKSYTFTIRINGEILTTKSFNDVSSYDNVSVFASGSTSNFPIYLQDGSIKNLLILNGISNSSGYQRRSLNYKNSTISIVHKKDKLSIVIGVTVPLFVVLVMITAVVVKVHRKKQLRHGKSTWMMNYMDSDLKDFNNSEKDEWEIFPGSIKLEKKIGEGAFGTVFIGKINPKIFAKSKNPKQKSFSSLHVNNELVSSVAVKLLKDSANQSEFDDFREEISLMKEIRYHKNIVNMIGCSTIKKPLCLIVEFMENGDLLNFLRNRRTKLFTSKVDKESANTFMYTESYQQTLETKKSEDLTPEYVSNEIRVDEVELLSPDDLLSFAWQVASGMEFLSYNKLVHRDLAARNILVGNEKNIKISDFGLTRKINDELNYMGNKNRRLPVKWMSVEAIFDQIFTSCSDVWAYGVVLFEIVTLGGTPYPSISNRELLALLKTGYRMDRPENCSELMYDMMLHCWNEDPLQRPTFTELREHLDEIISQGDSYFNFDVNEQSIYYNAASFNSLPSETADDTLDQDILENPIHVKSIEEIKKTVLPKSIEEINKHYNDPVAPSNELCLNGETFNRQTKLSLPIGVINNAFNESLYEI